MMIILNPLLSLEGEEKLGSKGTRNRKKCDDSGETIHELDEFTELSLKARNLKSLSPRKDSTVKKIGLNNQS